MRSRTVFVRGNARSETTVPSASCLANTNNRTRELTFPAVKLDDVQRERDLLERIVFLSDCDTALNKDLTEQRRRVAICRSIEGALLRKRAQAVQYPDDESYAYEISRECVKLIRVHSQLSGSIVKSLGMPVISKLRRVATPTHFL